MKRSGTWSASTRRNRCGGRPLAPAFDLFRGGDRPPILSTSLIRDNQRPARTIHSKSGSQCSRGRGFFLKEGVLGVGTVMVRGMILSVATAVLLVFGVGVSATMAPYRWNIRAGFKPAAQGVFRGSVGMSSGPLRGVPGSSCPVRADARSAARRSRIGSSARALGERLHDPARRS